jgi:hypothetical protein
MRQYNIVISNYFRNILNRRYFNSEIFLRRYFDLEPSITASSIEQVAAAVDEGGALNSEGFRKCYTLPNNRMDFACSDKIVDKESRDRPANGNH